MRILDKTVTLFPGPGSVFRLGERRRKQSNERRNNGRQREKKQKVWQTAHTHYSSFLNIIHHGYVLGKKILNHKKKGRRIRYWMDFFLNENRKMIDGWIQYKMILHTTGYTTL